MVLVSTRGDTPINEIAQLADKIIEVALPQISSVSAQPNSSDIEDLRAEIASLKQQINILKRASRRARSPHPRATSPHSRTTSPAPPSSQSTADTVCWYHKPLAILLTSVDLHALTRETTRPAADGDLVSRGQTAYFSFDIKRKISGLAMRD